jgi:hypothetical protein
MKQTVGLGVLLAVGVAAVRLVSGTATEGEHAAPKTGGIARVERDQREKPKPKLRTLGTYQHGCTVFDADLPRKATDPPQTYPKLPEDANRGAARSLIDHFFAMEEPGETLKLKTGIHYAIALAPDPRHTNLSLSFDRQMVAVQQAAQDEGYTYDTSWLPWKTEATSYSSVSDQQRAEDETDGRESCPGVVLFRKSTPDVKPGQGVDTAAPYGRALVVLVVGEQPTGGLNEDQWTNAMVWLNNNASAKEDGTPGETRVLSILGPFSSGTFVSLQRDLVALKAGADVFPSADTPVRILSGTVRGCGPIRWFQKSLELRKAPTTFGSFSENDELQIYRLLNYLRYQGTATSEVAILSEDETAYAGAPSSQLNEPPGPCDFQYARVNRPVRLSYPRDISALRTAYEKQSVFTGSSGRSSHAVLQETTAEEGESPAVSDTIPAFSGPLSPVAQESVLYGIVSNLRAHHSRYLMLRCTNPLDFLFLTRFFHRAYPEGRVVTVGSDLLFGREIDTTEFRGVLALSAYSLIPGNQHWSQLSDKPDDAQLNSHTHRSAESHNEGIYLAGRYLFDRGAAWPVPVTGNQPDHLKPLVLPFKSFLPDFGDPFWMHKSSDDIDEPKTIQAPTWLSVVGRDGYWPLAVLSNDAMPNKCLDNSPPEDDAPGPPGVPKKVFQCPPRPVAGTAPPSTMVQLMESARAVPRGSKGVHYDRTIDATSFYKTLLFSTPLSWWVIFGCAFMLLAYQIIGVLIGERYASVGLFAPFRSVDTQSQKILLAVNAALALLVFSALLTIRTVLPDLTTIEHSWTLGRLAMHIVILLLVLLVVAVLFRYGKLAGWIFALTFFLLAWITDVIVHKTLTHVGDLSANSLPLYYRMAHLTGGVSPLTPLLFLLGGLYLWSWQAMAGNALLDIGRPMLPRLSVPEPRTGRWQSFWDKLIGLLPDPCSAAGDLDAAFYRISHRMGRSIRRAASPLSFPFPVVVLPMCLLAGAGLFLRFNPPPLRSLEGKAYDWTINLALLLAFLLVTAEASRLYFTWIELRRLLTALNRLRFRRTFAHLRAIDSGSLWSVSGSVQRIQYLFFTEQMEAARRLESLPEGNLQGVRNAVVAGNAFATITASKIDTGPLWDQPIVCAGPANGMLIRDVLNTAVAETLNALIPFWETEKTSLSLQSTAANGEDSERHVFDMELSENETVRAAEEFVCFHYIAFIQNILARMRTMILSMIFLFVAVCLSISFYPFVPRTGIGMWMLVNLFFIAAVVISVYAAMERDETLSYITNTPVGKLSNEFYFKVAGFLAGPVLGLLTTQFPAISESVLGWLQPGLDALK